MHEKIMTHGKQYAKTDFHVDINGDNSSVNLVSRSVAKGESKQEFFSVMNGNAACAGHSECDAIIMDTWTYRKRSGRTDYQWIFEIVI